MPGRLDRFAFHFLQPGKRGRLGLSHEHGEILVWARLAEVQMDGLVRFKYFRNLSGDDHFVGMVGVGLGLFRRNSFGLFLRPGRTADAEDEHGDGKHPGQVQSHIRIHAGLVRSNCSADA